MSVDTSPKRLRDLADDVCTLGLDDLAEVLGALASEKDAQQPELSMSMFASKEEFREAVKPQHHSGIVKPTEVPLPALTEEDRQFLSDNPNTDDVTQFVLQYGHACAKAARDAERGRNAGWFALVMNAAAAIEDAANSLREPDAKKAAEGAAKHYRAAANAMWKGTP